MKQDLCAVGARALPANHANHVNPVYSYSWATDESNMLRRFFSVSAFQHISISVFQHFNILLVPVYGSQGFALAYPAKANHGQCQQRDSPPAICPSIPHTPCAVVFLEFALAFHGFEQRGTVGKGMQTVLADCVSKVAWGAILQLTKPCRHPRWGRG